MGASRVSGFVMHPRAPLFGEMVLHASGVGSAWLFI